LKIKRISAASNTYSVERVCEAVYLKAKEILPDFVTESDAGYLKMGIMGVTQYIINYFDQSIALISMVLFTFITLLIVYARNRS
jgi:hypothetical protein